MVQFYGSKAYHGAMVTSNPYRQLAEGTGDPIAGVPERLPQYVYRHKMQSDNISCTLTWEGNYGPGTNCCEQELSFLGDPAPTGDSTEVFILPNGPHRQTGTEKMREFMLAGAKNGFVEIANKVIPWHRVINLTVLDRKHFDVNYKWTYDPKHLTGEIRLWATSIVRSALTLTCSGRWKHSPVECESSTASSMMSQRACWCGGTIEPAGSRSSSRATAASTATRVRFSHSLGPITRTLSQDLTGSRSS